MKFTPCLPRCSVGLQHGLACCAAEFDLLHRYQFARLALLVQCLSVRLKNWVKGWRSNDSRGQQSLGRVEVRHSRQLSATRLLCAQIAGEPVSIHGR